MVTDEAWKLAAQMLTDVRGVKGLEVAIAGLLKENDDGHDFTQAQRARRLPLFGLGGKQMCLPARPKVGAEFVAIVKEA